jgi:cell division transport system ATP-binding protein
MRFEGITLAYGHKTILRNVSVVIEPGEFVFLIGGSGSGKTSFIRMLIGDFPPKGGMFVDNQGGNVYSYRAKSMARYRRNIGVIFQDFKLLKSKTVYENVAFAMEVSGYDDAHIAARVPEVLSQVGLLSKVHQFIPELSGGEVQRVAIARALIHDPDIVIGDEPTGNLDPKNSSEIMKILTELNAAGKTVIVATHDDQIVDRLKKRVIAFENAQVVSDEQGGGYSLEK